MILSLRGRLETRWFLAAAVALPWALLLTLLLRPGDDSIVALLRSTATTVGLMAALGSAWELAYHGLQQLRWDRDWPSALMLAAVLVEIGPLWWAVGRSPGVDRPSGPTFLALIGSAWLLMWLFVQGPMRVLFLRWRHNGGRLTCAR